MADSEVATRHLQPWGVVSYRGRWYVVGLDTDRRAPRLFRLSRVHGDVARDGRPGAFSVPEGPDIRSLTQTLVPVQPDRTALVLVREGTAHGLRRHAEALSVDAGGPVQEGWERLSARYARTDGFIDELLGYGADVVVEEPPEVRELVLERLRQLAGAR
jgi:proteasome accessory factor B